MHSRIGIVALVVLMMAGAATAQIGNYTMTMTSVAVPDAPIQPDAGHNVTVEWELTCPNALPAPATDVTVDWSFVAPEGIAINGSTQESITGPDCTTTISQGYNSTFVVSASRMVPALQTVAIDVAATASWGGSLEGTSDADVTFVVVPEYVPGFTLQTDPSVVDAVNGTAMLAVHITNLANGQSVFTFDTDSPFVIAPESIILDMVGNVNGTTNATVELYFQANDTLAADAMVAGNVTVMQTAALDAERTGEPLMAQYQFRNHAANEVVEGDDEDSPGLPLVGLLAVLGIAAFARRRK